MSSLAKQIAFRDIAEDCKKNNRGQNYLLLEREICWYIGIPVPDFRKFNGGDNKKRNDYGTISSN